MGRRWTGTVSTSGSIGFGRTFTLECGTCRPHTTCILRLYRPKLSIGFHRLSRVHPAWGCIRIADYRARDEIRVSHVLIQKILADNRMGTRHARLLIREERHCQNAVDLSAEMAALIEKADPCYLERHVESGCPDALYSQEL